MARDPLGPPAEEEHGDEGQQMQDLTCKVISRIFRSFYKPTTCNDREEASRALHVIFKNCYIPGILLICQFAGIPFQMHSAMVKKLMDKFHRKQLKVSLSLFTPPFSRQHLFRRALVDLCQVCVAADSK